MQLAACGGGGSVVAGLRCRSEVLLDGANAQLPWQAADATGLGLDLFWACGCCGCVLGLRELLQQ
jgi:hypothetical protein